MIDGDQNSFYCYRPSGQNASYYLEKYDKKSLNRSFSKEIEVDGLNVKPAGVFYSLGNIYIFNSFYDTVNCKVILNCRAVTASGELSGEDLQISFFTDNDFADISISMNPEKTGFLIKACYRMPDFGKYTTDFILVMAKSLKTAWKKNVEQCLMSPYGFKTSRETIADPGITYLGCSIDDNENLTYCYLDNSKNMAPGEENNSLKLAVFRGPSVLVTNTAASSTGALEKPAIMDLPLMRRSSITNVTFFNDKSNRLVIGGFCKVMNESEPLLTSNAGIFSFSVDLVSCKIESKQVRMFEPEFMHALQNAPELTPYYKYKMDNIFSIGADLFFVGQLFTDKVMVNSEGNEEGNREQMHESNYLDVIVAKLNAFGLMEWVKNVPVRSQWQSYDGLVSNSYFAVPASNHIYIFYNEHPSNADLYLKEQKFPNEWLSIKEASGSNFVFSAMAVTEGVIKHRALMQNESYCWTPFQKPDPSYPSADAADIYLPASGNEVFIYTEAPGKERFSRLNIR